MRVILFSNAKGQLTVGLLATCLLTVPYVTAMPRQSAAPGTPKTSVEGSPRVRSESAKSAKNPVLARNTSPAGTAAKPAPPTATPAAKKQQAQAKTTIGRCWKRLMDNVREITQAHRSKNK